MTDAQLEIRLLGAMLRIRMVEEAIAIRYSEQEMRCPVHLSIGQEAPSAAFSLAVQREDFAVSTHRGHAHYLAKGGALGPMIAEIYGKSTGCSRGRGGSMHLADKAAGFMGTSAIVGNSIPVGVGLGLALQIQGRAHASCVFLGDGATEEGVYYESANFAVVRNLPVVFLCENNRYSVYSPLSVRQPEGRSLTLVATSLGLTSEEVDGNDAIACYHAVNRALQQARGGGGPQFLEFHTFRHLEHCGPGDDDHLDYRQPGELQSWQERDPIDLLQAKLLWINPAFSSEIHLIRERIRNEIETAFAEAAAAPFPDLEECMRDVYA
jgi:TPP-dependent pyruvate/acetoin dehydrogenase alpha subunit